MPSIAEARTWAAEELKRAAVDSPVLTADLLLGFVLGCDRVYVITHIEKTVLEDLWVRYKNLVFRGAEGEPLEYLTGVKEFYGFSFNVTSDVLIPRPETELLVEKAIDLIKNGSSPGARFVDVGTGSGCIAISVAREIPESTAWAVDISAAALMVARENAIRHGVVDRIHLVQADLLNCFPPESLFDLILCNPPYVAFKEYDSLPHNVKDYEPHTALFGGESGVEVYDRLAPEIASRLVPGGYCLLELGMGQASYVGLAVEKAGLSLEIILNDLQGIPRCLVGRRPAGDYYG